MPAPSPRASGRSRQTVGRGWFSSSLPPKTFLGFTAAIFALVAMSLLSYRTLEERAAGARRLRQSFDVRHGLESLLSTIKDAELGERGYLLTGIERFLEPYESAQAELQGEFADTRRALGGAGDQLERLDGLERMVHDEMEDFARDIDRKRAGGDAAAPDLERQNRAKLMMDQIRRIVGEMQGIEQERLEARSLEWERVVQFSATVTWGGSAVLLFLIGVAAVMSSRDFREQRVQAWLQSGQSQLARRIQGDQSMETLGDNVASFLCEYLEAQLGAVYFADRGQLSRVGAYGLSRARQDDRGGGGLTRQAYDEGRLLSVLDLPDDFFEISSGLGKGKPRQLVIAPTRVEGIVDGVVELGFFRAVAPHDLELLARAGDQIGSALRSCRYRSELQNLLDETQRQAEELQTQQEEL
ncbi:MAG TPA: CHASE3 domain-containing protein, partial [Polyangiaceae bacterium]|nr:CHASE3 domain-containing protein [Polyangiaceae bacterium]